MLKVQRIRFQYSQHRLLNHVSFTLSQGELLHIKGPNGVGKTTLLKVLCALHRPLKGNILYDNQSIDEDLSAYHAALYFIGHSPGFHGALTVSETLASYQDLSQNSISSVLKACDLWSLRSVSCRFLSLGEKKRVALSRLMLQDRPLWILDEPYTGLDAKGCDWVNQLICQQMERGGSVILTAHQSIALQGRAIREYVLT
jgi:heme exporter protein A